MPTGRPGDSVGTHLEPRWRDRSWIPGETELLFSPELSWHNFFIFHSTHWTCLVDSVKPHRGAAGTLSDELHIERQVSYKLNLSYDQMYPILCSLLIYFRSSPGEWPTHGCVVYRRETDTFRYSPSRRGSGIWSRLAANTKNRIPGVSTCVCMYNSSGDVRLKLPWGLSGSTRRFLVAVFCETRYIMWVFTIYYEVLLFVS